MYCASAWQCEQVAAMLRGCTLERVSLAGRRSCTPWQSVHTATLLSPAARRLPCTLVWYWLSWSVRREGLYWRMNPGLEWQEPHSLGTAARSILPLNPAALLMALSSLLLGSPPWQLAQVNPFCAWMSWANCSWVTCSSPSSAEWQSTQLLGCCACATATAVVSSSTAPRLLFRHITVRRHHSHVSHHEHRRSCNQALAALGAVQKGHQHPDESGQGKGQDAHHLAIQHAQFGGNHF